MQKTKKAATVQNGGEANDPLLLRVWASGRYSAAGQLRFKPSTVSWTPPQLGTLLGPLVASLIGGLHPAPQRCCCCHLCSCRAAPDGRRTTGRGC